MSQKLSAKKKIKITLLLGGLGLIAVWTNSDVLFGQGLQPVQGNASVPATGVSAPSDSSPRPAPPGESVSESALGQREPAEGKVRNPFQTLQEQDPLSQPTLPQIQGEVPEMPPGLRAQIIFIGKTKRVASIEGARVKIGDSFYGGKVAVIEPKYVSVEFQGGKHWVIPLGSEALSNSQTAKD